MSSDISTTSWTETDSGNTQQPPNGWPGGINANAVEGIGQMMMGAQKRFWNRVNPTYLAALATTDSYTLSPTQAVTGYGLYERWRVRFPSASTATSPNILISSLPAQVFQKYNGAGSLVNLLAGDIQAQDHEFWWNGSQMVLANPAAPIPVTSIADATNGGLNFSAATGSVTAKVQPSDLLVKSPATNSDSVVIMDAAASNVAKTAVIPDLRNALGIYAWANVGSTGTVNASFNISSVTHTGTGIYTVHFTNSLSDANYAVVATASAVPYAANANTLATGTFVVNTTQITASPALADSAFYFVVYR